MFWYMMTGLKGLIFVRMGPSEVSPSDLCYALAKVRTGSYFTTCNSPLLGHARDWPQE